jgi:hexokinase
MAGEKALKNIERSFEISLPEIRRIVKDFHREMEKGLSGKESSLKMIPTYVDRPTGKEKGKFIALDLGGTNFRVLELELKGNRRIGEPKVMKFVLGKKHITGTAEDFFGFIASCVKTFLNKYKVGVCEERSLGFTFSFPVNQTAIAAGNLMYWTKGFNAKGVIGEDVVKLLGGAFTKEGMGNIKISALANDTVGTLAAKSYEEKTCDVGVILGTGTNACYTEKISRITKWHGLETETGYMIINIEWGNFNKLLRNSYDKKLDEGSKNPGQQILEKMVSGMYLGEVVRLVLQDLVKRKGLFNGRSSRSINTPQGFKSEHVSLVESDDSAALRKVDALLKKLGISASTREDRMLMKKVCRIASTRAARISASAIASVVTKMDPALSRQHTVAIDGSVYERHPHFSKRMRDCLKEVFGRKASRIKMVLAKDGSGKGAAVIAAVAAVP